jgi:flagellar biosynthesis protein FlhB
MHDDGDDKTEQPTARRREEAREEGQIARSADLTAAAGLLAALLLLKAFGPGLFGSWLGMTRSLGEYPGVTTDALGPWAVRVAQSAATILAPLLGLLLVITIAATASQSGLVLTWKKLTPNLDRLNPVSGAKRLCSGETVSRLCLGLLKVAAVALVAYVTIQGQLGAVLATGGLEARGVFALAAETLWTLALRLGVVLLILGIVDYLIQRWRLERQLRMSKQEIKEELKKMEGDPLIKQRRRQLQHRLALQRIQSEVPKATVVVTNPTHYAIALRYDEQTMSAPRLVAKGKDFLAERIRLIAQQNRVPIVERPPLARALYAGVEIGHEVPPTFYRAIAEVLAYVYRLAGRKAG